MWGVSLRRPVRRGAVRVLTNPWVLSAVGLAAASWVGMRLWRRN